MAGRTSVPLRSSNGRQLQRVSAAVWHEKDSDGNVVFGFQVDNRRIEAGGVCRMTAEVLPPERGKFLADADNVEESVWSFPPAAHPDLGVVPTKSHISKKRPIGPSTRPDLTTGRVVGEIIITSAASGLVEWRGKISLKIPA